MAQPKASSRDLALRAKRTRKRSPALKTVQENSDEDRKARTLVAARGPRRKPEEATFEVLTTEQENLGLTEFEGVQGSLRDNGNAMERVVNEDMSWLSEKDQRAILIPLMLMRRYEVEFRLTRSAEP